MEREGENVASMMVDVFAETDEFFLLGLSIPLDDAPILRARVNVLICYFEGSNAQSVPFVLDGLFKTIDCELAGAFLIQFVLLSQLIYSIST